MTGHIGVVGGGAIGTSVAADLTEAGLNVTVVDQWPAQVEAMKTKPVKVTMPDGDLSVRVKALHLCELAAERPLFDLVFLAVKSYDTPWLTQLVKPYLKGDGTFIGLQNGMNEETIVPIIGLDRTVACVVELSAEIYEPGLVQRDTTRAGTWLGIGELDGSKTQRLSDIANVLGHCAVVTVTDNILGAKWTKLVANSMTMGPFSLFGLRNWEAAALPGMTEISVALGRESVAVGTALGHRLEPIFGLTADHFTGSSDEVLMTAMQTLLGHTGASSTTATVHDARKGRRTELEEITGTVTRGGRQQGIPTPYNDAVLELGREIASGARQMDPSNLDGLRSRLP